jgi:hypothetical protein
VELGAGDRGVMLSIDALASAGCPRKAVIFLQF